MTCTAAHTTTAAVLVGRPAITGWLEAHGPAVYDADPHATPYASPGWLSGWTAQLPARDEPLLLLAHDPDGLPAALPLVRTPGSGALLCLVTALAGHEYVAPVGPGAQHPKVAAALADTLTELAAAGGVVLTLPYVPSTSALGRELARRPGWSRIPTETAVVALPWDPSALPRSARRQHARRDRQHADPDSPQITYRRTEPGDVDQLSAAAGCWTTCTPPAGPPALPSPTGRRSSTTARTPPPSRSWKPTAAPSPRSSSSPGARTRGRHWSAWTPAPPNCPPATPCCGTCCATSASTDTPPLDLGPTVQGQRAYKDQYGPQWGLSWHFLHTAPAVPAQIPREIP